MLTENKFSKYLIYAIGEIILVVIGILIALQINNWNELRKDNITEKEILITQLREMLEDTTRRSLMERDKDESDMLLEKLQKVPLPIYVK